MIFVDETDFNKNMTPLYGYAKVGEECYVKSDPKSANYTAISAITKSKVIGYQFYKGGVTGQEFGAFIINLLLNNPEMLENLSDYCFFIDNAPIHRAEIFKSFFQNIQILFNASYSPALNPIEEFFGFGNLTKEKSLLKIQ